MNSLLFIKNTKIFSIEGNLLSWSITFLKNKCLFNSLFCSANFCLDYVLFVIYKKRKEKCNSMKGEYFVETKGLCQFFFYIAFS